jgi:hypothetical protein
MTAFSKGPLDTSFLFLFLDITSIYYFFALDSTCSKTFSIVPSEAVDHATTPGEGKPSQISGHGKISRRRKAIAG